MKRPLVALVALIVLSGCKGSGGSSSALDPFLGRSRIEPPRTGAISAQPPETPYYSRNPQPGLAQPPSTTQAPSLPAYSPGASASPPQSGSLPPTTGQAQDVGGRSLGVGPPASPSSGSATNAIPAAIPGPSSSSSPTWTAPQSRPAPTTGPAQPYGVNPYPPSSGNSSSSLSPSSPSAPSAATGEGDRITIPFAARVVSDPPRQLAASGRPMNPLRSDAAAANQPSGGTPGSVGRAGVPSPYGRNAGQPGPAPNGATGTNRLAGRDRVIQVIEPGPRDYGNPLRSAPRPIDPTPRPDARPPQSDPAKPVNISDLPEPK
jgi:hypothetical protein